MKWGGDGKQNTWVAVAITVFILAILYVIANIISIWLTGKPLDPMF